MTRRSNVARKGDTVTLPRAEYEALVERLVAGEHPLRIRREHRGLTLQALAAGSGVGLSYISEIESGKKPGSADALKKLAGAFGLAVDDLLR
jgi:ribosome-binding protein aMBF1 (putative translation factor)